MMFYSAIVQAAPQIPSVFQGKWAAKKDCHFFAEVTTPSPGAEVTATEFNRTEYYCKLEKVITSNTKAFSGEFACTVEGEDSKETIAIKLNAKGKFSYEGSPALSKCN